MAKVTIGGTEYLVPELNFIALEKCWAHIQIAMVHADPIVGVRSAIHIIAAALQEDENFDKTKFGIPEEVTEPAAIDEGVALFLKKAMKPKEITSLQQAIEGIIEEAGLGGDAGEAQEETPESLSTETSQQSSPASSQPESKEEAGTA